MCIYCTTTNYRKIYEHHHGAIPKDEHGRTYEIHHIDGDHSNNDPNNLAAVSIQEHYEIHKQNGDWGACRFIADRMGISPQELSALSVLHNQKMIAQGTHPFQGGKLQLKRLHQGIHHFQGSAGSELAKKRNSRLIAEGKLYAHTPEHSAKTKQTNKRMIDSGIHPSQIHISCIICRKTCSVSMFKRWHGDNCKLINDTATKKASDKQKQILKLKPNAHFSVHGHQLKLSQGKSSAATQVTCPHCNKTMTLPNARRWHLDKCKNK